MVDAVFYETASGVSAENTANIQRSFSKWLVKHLSDGTFPRSVRLCRRLCIPFWNSDEVCRDQRTVIPDQGSPKGSGIQKDKITQQIVQILQQEEMLVEKVVQLNKIQNVVKLLNYNDTMVIR